MKQVSRQRGFTLIEVMIAITLSMVVLLALATLFRNTNRNNDEMARSGDVIDSGRAAIAVLTDDLAHAGFWAGYIPAFDDLMYGGVPGDVPAALPTLCATFSSLTTDQYLQRLGIVVQASDTLTSGTGCVGALANRAGSDVLAVRRVETCAAGDAGCTADTSGPLFIQASRCNNELEAQAVGGSNTNTLQLASTASAVDNAYVGALVRIIDGAGAGQVRRITAYTGSSRTATVSPNWTTSTSNTSVYSLPVIVGTAGAFGLRQRDCLTAAPKWRYQSNLYYVSNITRNGTTTPTLVRSRWGSSGSTQAQLAPEELVPGVEAFRIEFGIDTVGETGAAIDLTQAVEWQDPDNLVTVLNRGDGDVDSTVRCTTAAPCTAAQLRNVVGARLYVLARAREPSRGYTDTKTYCLGEPAADGSCPAESSVAAANDSFRRHVFMASVRLHNVSGRRETP